MIDTKCVGSEIKYWSDEASSRTEITEKWIFLIFWALFSWQSEDSAATFWHLSDLWKAASFVVIVPGTEYVDQSVTKRHNKTEVWQKLGKQTHKERHDVTFLSLSESRGNTWQKYAETMEGCWITAMKHIYSGSISILCYLIHLLHYIQNCGINVKHLARKLEKCSKCLKCSLLMIYLKIKEQELILPTTFRTWKS